MKILKRNTQIFYYALYKGMSRVISSRGYNTGEPIVEYENPVLKRASISPASGQSYAEIFGSDINYTKVIITDDMTCPIDENSALWVDTMPVLNDEGETTTAHDYKVTAISKSLNCIAYAIARVNKQ